MLTPTNKRRNREWNLRIIHCIIRVIPNNIFKAMSLKKQTNKQKPLHIWTRKVLFPTYSFSHSLDNMTDHMFVFFVFSISKSKIRYIYIAIINQHSFCFSPKFHIKIEQLDSNTKTTHNIYNKTKQQGSPKTQPISSTGKTEECQAQSYWNIGSLEYSWAPSCWPGNV